MAMSDLLAAAFQSMREARESQDGTQQQATRIISGATRYVSRPATVKGKPCVCDGKRRTR